MSESLKAFLDRPDRFDLVITDMTMPHMTGTTLSKKLMEVRPDVPIILLTGHHDHINKDKAKEIGIRGFAIKPDVMKDLANTACQRYSENEISLVI
jgi:YesN/AraC family two-component response regulator